MLKIAIYVSMLLLGPRLIHSEAYKDSSAFELRLESAYEWRKDVIPDISSQQRIIIQIIMYGERGNTTLYFPQVTCITCLWEM